LHIWKVISLITFTHFTLTTADQSGGVPLVFSHTLITDQTKLIKSKEEKIKLNIIDHTQIL